MGQRLAAQSAGAVSIVAAVDIPAQYLTFALAGKMFAAGILNVKEIIEYGKLTEVPLLPAFIRGVINLRGSVVPVIDLAARFGGLPTAVGKRSCIVIVEVAGDDGAHHDIGILVDAVSEVLDIPGSEIEPPPSFGAKMRSDFIFGMGKVAGDLVIILNIDKVLSVEEITQITGTEVGVAKLAAAEVS